MSEKASKIEIPQYCVSKMPKKLTPTTVAVELKSMCGLINIISDGCLSNGFTDLGKKLKFSIFAINEIIGIATKLGGEKQDVYFDKPDVISLQDPAAALLSLELNLQVIILRCDGEANPSLMGRLLLILTHFARLEGSIR